MYAPQYDEEMDRLYSCCDDKKVICWDAIALKQEKIFDGHKDKVPLLRTPAASKSFTTATARSTHICPPAMVLLPYYRCTARRCT